MSDLLIRFKQTQTGFQLEGQLTFDTISSVLKQGKAYIDQNQEKSIVINFEGLRRIDSAGISLLLEWKRDCAHKNIDLLIEGNQKQANSLIKTYKLQQLF